MLGEWRWLLGFTLVTLALTELPHAVAAAQIGQGQVFVGMAWFPHDAGLYLAAMLEGGASSAWLIHNHFTPEPHEPALIYGPYVAFGKLASHFSLDLQAAFQLLSVASRAVLLISIYLLSQAILPTVAQRRLALVLVVFSSGLGVPFNALLAGLGAAPVAVAQDYHPELNTFVALLTAPHVMLGLALILLIGRSYLLAWTTPGLGQPLLAALLVLLLGLVNPFGLVAVCGAPILHLVVMRLQRTSVPPGALLSAALIVLAACPMLLYNLVTFKLDPFWGTVYDKQNFTLNLSPIDLALTLGPLALLMLLGLPTLRRQAPTGAWLVLAWIVVGLLLMHLPLGVPRRFALGLQPLLGLPAAVGLQAVWRWIRARHHWPLALDRALLTVLLPQALFASTVLLYGYVLLSAANPLSPLGNREMFQPVALVEAGRWLGTVVQPDQVVLGDLRTGNYLGGVISGRVLVGHRPGTLEYPAKEAAVQQFYAAASDETSQRHLLEQHRVRYVVYGPHEQALGATAPPPSLALRPVYESAELSIYEVPQRQTARISAPEQ